jgi:hypothetical protein
MIVSATAKHLTAIVAALGLMVASTSTATGRADGVHFVAGAHRVVQGNEVSMSVSVSPAGVRCSASVRYKGGKTQSLSTVAASGGRASWKWKVERSTTPGPALVSVACGPAGRASRTLTVIGAVLPPAIRVVKSGWSVRPMIGGGSSVSYGVILANESRTRDALDVKVLVNFVMEDNRLIGSATTHVADIAAGTEHAMGGDLLFPGGAPISPWEPSWTGSVEGELQNDDPALTLSRAELSAVVLDAAGNVIGGGHGNAFTPVPPATRLFFKINQGLRAIPIGKAATALVSVVPTYDKPGT